MSTFDFPAALITRADVQVWTMRTDHLTESDVAAWQHVLDETEQTRAARFMFASDRITFVAAHVLLRVVLSRLHPQARPADWRFDRAAHGKPCARFGDAAAPLSFNLSHTRGMAGVAAAAIAGLALGFDLEALDRKVTLAVADRYFCPEEVDWLTGLAEPARPQGFLRLWTLKEAFIKATGQGLAQDLSTFWFDPLLLRIYFTPALAERPEEWRFEQRQIAGRFLGAIGLRLPESAACSVDWVEIDPAGLAP